MLAMISYVVIVGALLSIAALVAEYGAKQRGTSRRWIWMTTIIASLLLPLIIPNVTVHMPDLIKPATSDKPIALRDMTSVRVPLAVLDLGMPDTAARTHWLDTFFHRMWLALSFAMLAAVVLSGGLLYWRKRRWMQGLLCGPC